MFHTNYDPTLIVPLFCIGNLLMLATDHRPQVVTLWSVNMMLC